MSHQDARAPRTFDIPMRSGDALEMDCSALVEDPTEVCEILESEDCRASLWAKLAYEYNLQGMTDQAIEILERGSKAPALQKQDEKLPLKGFLAALYLRKARTAPARASETTFGTEAKTKDFYFGKATSELNDARRLDFKWHMNPLFQGIFQTMRSGSIEETRRAFDAVHAKTAANKPNLVALLGRAKVLYEKKKWKESLKEYQRVLTLRPTMRPDPRIGIGLCYWKLGRKEMAKAAWERSNKVEENASATALLGLWYVDAANNTMDPGEATPLYQKGFQLSQAGHKMAPGGVPAAAVPLIGQLFSKKAYEKAIGAAEKLIKTTDVKTVLSDLYMWLARAHHAQGHHELAQRNYQLAVQLNEDNLVAKFGLAQMYVQLNKNDEEHGRHAARNAFHDITKRYPKCVEACVMLGLLLMEDVLRPDAPISKGVDLREKQKIEAQSVEARERARKDAKEFLRKGIKLMETTEGREFTDPELHLQLAKLCEVDEPKAAYEALKSAMEYMQNIGERLSPALGNNIAVLMQRDENYEAASVMYQQALEEVSTLLAEDPGTNRRPLLTTLSYNLGRVQEASGKFGEARKSYEQILEHCEYVEARVRLVYMDFVEGKVVGGDLEAKAKKLLEDASDNSEVRAFYGWALAQQKMPGTRIKSVELDLEARHYKQTLRNYGGGDLYSLVGFGNLYLRQARDMKPTNEKEKEERSKVYLKAIEFFEAVLKKDHHNAYAAQGIAIALAENKVPDQQNAKLALRLLSKVKEAVPDVSVLINLGHVYNELNQLDRAIEFYEMALKKDESVRAEVIALLGRIWIVKAKSEKNWEHFYQALRYAKEALELAPEDAAAKFNVAFTQFSFAEQMVYADEANRRTQYIQDAVEGLKEAVQGMSELAEGEHKSIPYPIDTLKARVAQGRKYLDERLPKALDEAEKYEKEHEAQVAEAWKKVQDERDRRKQEAADKEKMEREEQARIVEERKTIAEQTRQWREKRAEEERQEMEVNSDGEEVPKRKKKAVKKSKKRDTGTDDEESAQETDDGAPRKRRSKKKKAVDTDEEGSGNESDAPKKRRRQKKKAVESDDEGDEEAEARPKKKKKLAKKEISKEMVDSDEDDDVPMRDVVEDTDNDAPQAAADDADEAPAEKPADDDVMGDAAPVEEPAPVAEAAEAEPETVQTAVEEPLDATEESAQPAAEAADAPTEAAPAAEGEE
ncbi:TPR-like protein [Saitoella complicata NRRL Y-17804]|nr:TPR-like protein [Saitoella complicata NRRL Y-17804]ODQ54576.1 TPR-like protein [Saitoella complicata NRRL Y-17804]